MGWFLIIFIYLPSEAISAGQSPGSGAASRVKSPAKTLIQLKN